MVKILLYSLALALVVAGAGPASAGLVGTSSRDCIGRKSIRAETAESDTSLIFHAGGSRAYRNTLPAPCDGLRSINVMGELAMRTRDEALLCAGDLVWLRHRSLFGSDDAAQSDADACKLGRFEPISEMSVTEFLRR